MKLLKLNSRSNKGKNRLASIKQNFPDWDEMWFTLPTHDLEHQMFIMPQNVNEPERFARWVKKTGDPNFEITFIIDGADD
ncbi:hypothetical protein b3_0099 [Synechococcus phage B3]|nr:hypothetical protein b3_0099 [Synechococcus phage B3]QGT54713.1 hypothetical protein b23_0098 [Synechococcus phage B23]